MAVVLVTGGAGYVGSHACKTLAEAGHTPIVFDNLRTGHRAAVQFGPLVERDLLDEAALETGFRTHRAPRPSCTSQPSRMSGRASAFPSFTGETT